MLSSSAQLRLYNLALRMNPQQGTFYSRVAPGLTPATGGYTLYRATFKEVDRSVTQPGALRKTVGEWTFYALDLGQAGAPNPKIDDRWVDASGQGWTLKHVRTVVMGACFICECTKELPTNSPIN